MSDRKLIMYISMSVDGFIATKDDNLDWLSVVEQQGEDYGYVNFNAKCDTYIVGKTTYDTVLRMTGGEFPQSKNLKCYVITRQELADKDGVTFYNGDLEKLIQKIKSEEGKHIYFDGGSIVAQMLMQKNLIDEYIISIIPIVLGNGKRLFRGETDKFPLKALNTKMYDSGLIQVHYERQQ